MNWLSNLLRKPTAKTPPPAARPPLEVAPKPVIDLDALRRALATAEGEEALKQAAHDLGRALATKAQAPCSDDPPAVWVAAISYAGDRQLGLAWLGSLHGDNWLGEVAARARIAEIRLAAAQRIEDSAALDKLAHDCRDKDKRVYRHCTETLRQRQRQAEHARRRSDLAEALGALVNEAPLPLSRLLTLEKELKELQADGAQLGNCESLLEQARTRLQQDAAARREWTLRQAEAAALAAECAGYEIADAATLAGLRHRLTALVAAYAAVPAWLAGNGEASPLPAIEARITALAADAEALGNAEAFLAPLDAETAAAPATIAAWEALAKPAHAPTRQALEARWKALRRPAPTPAPAAAVVAEAPLAAPVVAEAPKEAPRKIDPEALRALLDQIEAELGHGHLHDAEGIARQIETLTAGATLPAAADTRLQRAHAELGKLRGWARWSTVQARERLIATAEDLARGEHSVEALATEVPALREEWKKLNAHGPAAKGQWESFDTALEKAYAPVGVRRAEDAARQAEARVAREAMCAEWEAWLAGIAWQHADFQVVETRRQEILAQWRDAPHAGFRDERLLRKRFDTLIAALDAQLDTARGSEVERREQIIAAAEALRDAPDAIRATTEAKALQERWRDQAGPLRLKRADEQKLWQRFRAACDTVFARRDAEFARRDAQRAEQVAQREERKQARQALLDAFAETLASATDKDLRPALNTFRSEWNAQRVGPRDAGDALDARARDLQQQAQQRLDDLRRQKVRGRFDLLARKAALAASVEAAALAGDASAAETAAREAWASLPRLPGPAEAQLAERLAAAASIDATALARGEQQRDALLLDLEMLLDLPSPEHLAEQRRARQLERLQQKFGNAGNTTSEAENLLTRCHALAAGNAGAARLQAAIEKLVEQALAAHA